MSRKKIFMRWILFDVVAITLVIVMMALTSFPEWLGFSFIAGFLPGTFYSVVAKRQ